MASKNNAIEECEGLRFPTDDVMRNLKKSLKEHVEEVKAMKIQKDDIFVCAFPKCGKSLLKYDGAFCVLFKKICH